MKATSTAVITFIRDFNLMNPEGVVNFVARLEIKAGEKVHWLKSEVFILSVDPKSIDSINFLNTEIADLDFPIMFQSGKEVFSYIDDVCLMIIGNNAENGDYVISIFPEKSAQPASL